MHGCQLCVLIVALSWIHRVNTQREGGYKASICYDVIGRAALSVRCPAPEHTMRILDAFSGISAGDTCSYQPRDCVTREESHLPDQCNGRAACDITSLYSSGGDTPVPRERPRCRNGTATYIHVAYTCQPPGELTDEIPIPTSEAVNTTLSLSTESSTTQPNTTLTTETKPTRSRPRQPSKPSHTRPRGITVVVETENLENVTWETSTDMLGDSPQVISIWENDFTLVVIVAGSAIGLVIVAALVWTLVKKARGEDVTREPQPSTSDAPGVGNQPGARQPRRNNQRYLSSPHQNQPPRGHGNPQAVPSRHGNPQAGPSRHSNPQAGPSRQVGGPHAVAVPAHMNHRQLRQLALYERQNRR